MGATPVHTRGMWSLPTLTPCEPTQELRPGSAPADRKQYRIIVRTGDVRGAGTDSDVFFTLHGTRGSTAELELADAANNFERGRTDTFQAAAADVGTIERASVRVKPAFLGPAWNLDTLEIEEVNGDMGSLTVFAFQQWFDGKHGWEHARGVQDKATPALVSYRVVVNTSDVRGAGAPFRARPLGLWRRQH